jgi:hypothetical protein
MSTVQAQHPAVVLRSSYRHLRALLAIAAIVVVGLTIAVVVLAISNGGTSTASPATHGVPQGAYNYPGHF